MTTNLQVYKADFANVDVDDLVGFVANELDGGAFQAVLTEEQIEDGLHYADAREFIENSPIDMVRKAIQAWRKTKRL